MNILTLLIYKMKVLNKFKRFLGLIDPLQHPATTMSFNKLYKGLMERVEKGYINVQRSNGLEIFSYSKSCVYDGAWDKFTTMARGLILSPHFKDKRIVALTFPKFWNLGEVSTILPDLPFTVLEKIDGSLGIIFYWRGKWQVATKGSFISDQSQWATEWLNKNVATVSLDTNLTYLTEIIYHSNKIVVSYDFEGLVLLSGYDLKTGLEVLDIARNWFPDFDKLRIPKSYRYDSLDKMIEVAATLDSNNEGFVVRFSNGYRIKIKGQDYCRVHRLISNCTPLAIWDMMRNLDDLDVIRKDLPEEHQRDFDMIRALLQDQFDDYVFAIREFYEDTEDLSDKELGLKLSDNYFVEISKAAKTFVFACRKKGFLDEVYETPDNIKHARRALFDKFRPTGNILEGFIPSSAMNRFEEENL